MLVYTLLVRAYGAVIRLASVNNKKAAQWVRGRHNWRQSLSENRGSKKDKTLWVHCASYGEFEQGRPLIEAIKKTHPEYRIVLSFFSPSGYEAFKNWEGAETVCYLPLDTRRNARDFIEIIQPSVAIFIKYEFWVNFLFQLKKKNIPTYLVSAVFKPHHPFFKWYGGIFRRSLTAFTKLFIQDEASGELLRGIGITNYEVSGDTRFDRVLQVKTGFRPLPFFETFCGKRRVIMAGSTWPKDEELLLAAFLSLQNTDVKLVLVPHNVDQKSISNLEQQLEKNKLSYQLYSSGVPDPSKQVLVVDAMGLLSRLYHYATVAYIGGGFNDGLHNSLEAAVYGIPVTFYGSDYENYNEAVDLLQLQAAVNVRNANQLTEAFEKFLGDDPLRLVVYNKMENYFAANANSTSKVLAQLPL